MRPNLILLALLSTALAHSHKSPTGRFRRTSFGKRRLSSEITRRATLFIPLDYTDGQISYVLFSSILSSITSHAPLFSFDLELTCLDYSDGTAGSAQEEADAVCRAPFANVDLSTVSQEDLKNLATFRSAAESAETELFNPQVRISRLGQRWGADVRCVD